MNEMQKGTMCNKITLLAYEDMLNTELFEYETFYEDVAITFSETNTYREFEHEMRARGYYSPMIVLIYQAFDAKIDLVF